MTDRPLATIIIRTYNRATRISRAIDSALAQDWTPREIIVVDDGSADNTREVVEAYAARGVRYVWQKNQGVTGARFTGLAEAKGDFIALLDSDDTWQPEYLGTLIRLMEKHGSSVGFCNYERVEVLDYDKTAPSNVENSSKMLPYLNHPHEQEFYLPPAEMRAIFLDSPTAPSSCTVLRARDIATRYRDKIPWDDWLMLLEMILTKNVSGSFFARKLLTKYNYDDGICEGGLTKFPYYRQVVAGLDVFLRNFRGQLTPAEKAPWIAMITEYAFDLGHLEASAGNLRKSLHYYGIAFRESPSLKTGLAAAKACGRSLTRKTA